MRQLTGKEKLLVAEMEEDIRAALVPVLNKYAGGPSEILCALGCLMSIANGLGRAVGFGRDEMEAMARVGFEPQPAAAGVPS